MNEELETEMPKRGPGRPPKIYSEQETPVNDSFDEYVWCPGEGDSAITKWNGLTFKAGVPTKVRKDKTIKQLIPKKFQQADGSFISRGFEVETLMRDAAMNNPRFSINGQPPAKQKSLGQPTTPEEYVRYATKWIMLASSATSMDARWNVEEELREQCGVENKEVSEIMSIFDARRQILGAFTA